jgi:hypothetical protein
MHRLRSAIELIEQLWLRQHHRPAALVSAPVRRYASRCSARSVGGAELHDRLSGQTSASRSSCGRSSLSRSSLSRSSLSRSSLSPRHSAPRRSLRRRALHAATRR